MTIARTPTGAAPTRGRRLGRSTGDDREVAILATAERLLRERPFGDISIDDLAKGAGISRPTFYFYFSSKDAVLLTLLDRVTEEANAAAGDVLDRLAEDPRARWRELIARFHATFGGHRAVVLACAQVRGTNAEVRRLWAEVLERWVRAVEAAIEGERRRGAAPDGLPARDLAIALNSMNERVWYATFAGDGPAVAERDVVDVLLDVWLTAIYRTTTPSPA
ncbi:TetR/AcrR family transcriptional regulator [Micromonospora sp. DR5-3]|uniref:TetR/AcrR family transcriptional regulator n=1 Tax=unclassified Micromonospora TaxID=2617518 RepID=UPI0011D3EAB1|nr:MULTISPECIES: TetR/AcrR family transcriptional regulator [unclassified Micromonospora]MCW3819251.1 TetR/AcrR family transcriptional regulator [Micromonospora sp. DR5-3]TYC20970.1 TetR/AcrR family transcriptional regulator [Micromonospora sp. MP36]